MTLRLIMIPLILSGLVGTAAADTVLIPVTEDFTTTRWAFGAPYVRGINEPSRSSLGVSTPNPFLQSTDGSNDWEETTYFLFDTFAAFAPDKPVTQAKLQVRTVARPWGSPAVSAANPFSISAQRVHGDPMSIDSSVVTGANSFTAFKSTSLGSVEDVVTLTSAAAAVYEWDVTDLVNEWIAHGQSNVDFSIAMTGRANNAADTTYTGAFHAFVNSESASAQVPARLVLTVPEPTTLASVVVAAAMIRRRRA